MENYQFQYDGSDEAKECIREINRVAGHEQYWGLTNTVYTNNLLCTGSIGFSNYHILTPTEFLARFKADHPDKDEGWQPKYGEMVNGEWEGDKLSGHYIASFKMLNGDDRYLIQTPCNYFLQLCTSIYPIKPSVRDKIRLELGKVSDWTIDRIIEIVKGGSDQQHDL